MNIVWFNERVHRLVEPNELHLVQACFPMANCQCATESGLWCEGYHRKAAIEDCMEQANGG